MVISSCRCCDLGVTLHQQGCRFFFFFIFLLFSWLRLYLAFSVGMPMIHWFQKDLLKLMFEMRAAAIYAPGFVSSEGLWETGTLPDGCWPRTPPIGSVSSPPLLFLPYCINRMARRGWERVQLCGVLVLAFVRRLEALGAVARPIRGSLLCLNPHFLRKASVVANRLWRKWHLRCAGVLPFVWQGVGPFTVFVQQLLMARNRVPNQLQSPFRFPPRCATSDCRPREQLQQKISDLTDGEVKHRYFKVGRENDTFLL